MGGSDFGKAFSGTGALVLQRVCYSFGDRE
jgi:hypothetical protein